MQDGVGDGGDDNDDRSVEQVGEPVWNPIHLGASSPFWLLLKLGDKATPVLDVVDGQAIGPADFLRQGRQLLGVSVADEGHDRSIGALVWVLPQASGP